MVRRAGFGLAIAAVLIAALVFKVRVAVAGGKFLLVLILVIGLVWLLGKTLRR